MYFVESVIEGLKDLGEKEMDVEEMKVSILNEMYNQMDYYAGFHPTGKCARNVLLDAEKIFQYKLHTTDIVDVCIAATANTLGVNLYIYEEIGTQAVIIQQPCAFQTTQKGIFLHYHHDVNDPKNLIAHYDAILDIPPPPGQLPNDEDNSEVTCNSPNPCYIL